jgi:hypothetical protein
MRVWNDVLEALKENNCQYRLLYPGKLLFITEREITSHYKQNYVFVYVH